jgi:hypothetical protein
MNGHQNVLNIKVFNSPAEAPMFRPPEFKAARIDYVNVVRKGTEEGRSTIDLVFETEDGQKFVILATARLFVNLASIIGHEG